MSNPEPSPASYAVLPAGARENRVQRAGIFNGRGAEVIG